MFYFFSRGTSFVRCEIRQSDMSGCYEIVVAAPGMAERVDVFSNSQDAHEHFLRVQQELNSEGWWGPHGRD